MITISSFHLVLEKGEWGGGGGLGLGNKSYQSWREGKDNKRIEGEGDRQGGN